ncbi:MAG: DUF975 family protein [Clostridia bacterium]|nr:DUF975 family protein [Clostridia bacterium]MBR1704745.1 DUF975 family protein [Clostridia bacterium]
MNRIELKQRARENVRNDRFAIILITLIATAIMSGAVFGTFTLPLGGLFDVDFLTVAPASQETVTATPTAKGDEFDLDDFFNDDGEFDADHFFGRDEDEFSTPFQNPFADGDYSDDYYDGFYEDDTVDVDFGSAGLALAIFLLTGALTAGLLSYHLKVWRGEEGELKDLLSKFNKDFPRITKMYLLQTLYVSLWTLLFIVPGIVMAIAYSQAYFLMLDDPELSATDALIKSKELMKGKKWDYFVMYVSFLGWIILSVLTFGILFLWVNPYLLQTLTGYYHENIRPAYAELKNRVPKDSFDLNGPASKTASEAEAAPEPTVTDDGVKFTDVEERIDPWA